MWDGFWHETRKATTRGRSRRAGQARPVGPRGRSRLPVPVGLAALAALLALGASGAAAAPFPSTAPPPGPALVLARLDSLLAAGQPQQAAPLALRAVERWGDDPLFGWQLTGRAGAALRAAGRATEALPLLERAAASHPGDSSLHHELGLTLGELGRRGRALAEFEQASTLDPAAVAPHFEAGRLRAALGDWRRARDEVERGRVLCGGCPEADRLLASLLLRAGQPAEALPPLRRLWETAPDSLVRRNLVGALAAAARDSDLLALVAATPPGARDRDDWRMAIQAEARRGEAGWALAALAVSDTVDSRRFPGDEAVFWAQAALNLLAVRDAAGALRAVDRALARAPGNAVYHHNRAAALAALGRDAEARRELATAAALGDSSAAPPGR